MYWAFALIIVLVALLVYLYYSDKKKAAMQVAKAVEQVGPSNDVPESNLYYDRSAGNKSSSYGAGLYPGAGGGYEGMVGMKELPTTGQVSGDTPMSSSETKLLASGLAPDMINSYGNLNEKINTSGMLDYDSMIQKVALESDIGASHAEFAKQLHRSAGSSELTLRDDFTPPVPWHGLPRKALYAQIGAESSARTIESETPDQVAEFMAFNRVSYVL